MQALKRAGWIEFRVPSGSHHHLMSPDRSVKLTIPVHAGKIIAPGLLKSLLNQAGMNVEELRKLL